ncbi:MAG: tyrosine-type recombinase/integrase [Acidobacteriota bacterium]
MPMPTWVKVAVDAWTGPAGVADGYVFRSVSRADRVGSERLGEKVVWQMLGQYAAAVGVPGIAPHDLRRTCAKLCRAAGGELEQIQLLLGRASVQTTERYLGNEYVRVCRQDAPATVALLDVRERERRNLASAEAATEKDSKDRAVAQSSHCCDVGRV